MWSIEEYSIGAVNILTVFNSRVRRLDNLTHIFLQSGIKNV